MKISAGRVFGDLQIGTGPRHSPLACSEMLEGKPRTRRAYILNALVGDLTIILLFIEGYKPDVRYL